MREPKEDRDGNDSEHGNAGDSSVGKTSNEAIPGDCRLSGSSDGDDGGGKPEDLWNRFNHANDGRWGRWEGGGYRTDQHIREMMGIGYIVNAT